MTKFTASQRLKILREVTEKKRPVSHVCREYGISRTLFYRWFKRYKEAKPRERRAALAPKKRRVYYQKGQIMPQIEKKIIELIKEDPRRTARKIHQLLTKRKKKPIISLHGVQRVLERLELNTYQKRKAFARKKSITVPYFRQRMIERVVKRGEPVTKVCREYGISRTAFYRWLKRYQESGERLRVLWDKRPKVKRYWRQATEVQVEAVLKIAIQHPEYSTHKIAEMLDWIGNHGVQNIFRRNGLNNYEKRLAYAEIHAPIVAPAWYEAPFERISAFWRDLVSTISVIPPPSLGKAIEVSPYFFASMVTSAIFFSVSYRWLLIVLAAQGLAKIGMIFASISLTAGSLFFAYSMKYYFTLALVLSFSRQPTEEGGGYIVGLNGRIDSPSVKQGWLQKIFGVGEGNGERSKMTPAGGLQPSLDHIKLKRYPFVSIHLPLYNEKRVVERILKACASMDYPNYEIIVCDDSTDETTKIVQKFAQEHNQAHPKGPIIKVLHRPTRTGFKGGALKYAVEQLNPKTEFCVVFDADFVPYSDNLEMFVKYFKANNNGSENYTKNNIAVVGGYQWHVLNKSENWITRGVRTEYAGSYVIERPAREILGLLKQISGSVYMIRADVLKKIGWGTSITEDFQLTLKLYEQGYKVIYTPYVQAPAECVSTLKRLIRQRMRWAEGHSNNIRRMFLRLMKSPKLSLMEKLEVLYISPYYLQAAFFIVGTFSWLLAETVFRARLPFWTSLWGWSLVLTNFFSLPLMNAVGLFLEESEERDYTGIISFIFLSYILVPFQAYASVKGFLEKEEGPWFRTPKTGKITDIFTRGRFYRFISGILPGRRPAVAPSAALAGKPAPAFANPYLALATANNRFNNFAISSRKAKWLGRVVLVVLLTSSILVSSLAPAIPFALKTQEARAFGSILGPDSTSSPQARVEEKEEPILEITEYTPEKTPKEFYLWTAQRTNEAEVIIPETKKIGEELYVPYLVYQYPDRYEVEIKGEKNTQKYVLSQDSLELKLYQGKKELGLSTVFLLQAWLQPWFQYQGEKGWKDYIEAIPLNLAHQEEKDLVIITSSFFLLAPEEGKSVPGKMILKLGFNGKEYLSSLSFEMGENFFVNRLFLEQFGQRSAKEEWFHRQGIKGGFKAETTLNFSFGWEHFELTNSLNKEAKLKIGLGGLSEGVEVRYKTEEKRLKEEIVLREKPKDNTFSFELNLEGLTFAKLKGQYYFFDQEGVSRLIIPQPFMVDSQGERSEEIEVTITERDNQQFVGLTANSDWLADSNRAYPVIIDPTVKVVEDEELVRELLDKRNRTSKTYDLGNGKYDWEGSIGPIHYQNEKGDWQEIDTTFKKSSNSDFAYEVTANDFKVYFKENLTDEFYFQYQSSKTRFYQGIKKEQEGLGKVNIGSQVQVKDNTLTYSSIFEGVDLRYTLTPTKLLEEYIIYKPEYAQKISSLVQILRIESAYWEEKEDGSIQFFDQSTGQPVFSFPKPVMYELTRNDAESSPDGEDAEQRGTNYGLHYEIGRPDLIGATLFAISKVLNPEGKAWLADETRVYPLIIDTTVDKQVGASGDDGRRTGTASFNTLATAPTIGQINSVITHVFARWTGVTISGTITTSYITCYGGVSSAGTPLLKVYGVDEDNPAAPTTYDEFDADPLTAGVDWDGIWTNGDWNQSPSLNSIFQALVNSYTISDEAVMIQIKDDGSANNEGNQGRHWDFGNNTFGYNLHIEYNQVDTSTSANATAYSFQRKTWFDGTRLWSAFYSGTQIEFWYSADWGVSWSQNTSATISVSTNDFSIEADSSNAFIVYTSSNDIIGQKATSYPGTGFGWDTAVTVFNGSGATDDYSYPTIFGDSSDYVWVVARFTGSSVYYMKAIKETSAVNDLPEDSGDTVYSLSDTTNANANVYGVIVPVAAQDMYCVWIANAAIQGSVWDNSDSRWEDSSGNANSGGSNVDAIDTGLANLNDNLSAVVDTTNNDVHLVFIDDEATDQISYKRWDSGTQTWDASATLAADAADNNDSYVTISYDTNGTDLYAIWIDTSASDIFYSSCDISTNCDTAAEWVAETNWQPGGTNAWVTSNYSGAGMIYALWTEGSASPYSVTWDYIIIPERLWLFLLLSPLAGRILEKIKKRRRKADDRRWI